MVILIQLNQVHRLTRTFNNLAEVIKLLVSFHFAPVFLFQLKQAHRLTRTFNNLQPVSVRLSTGVSHRKGEWYNAGFQRSARAMKPGLTKIPQTQRRIKSYLKSIVISLAKISTSLMIESGRLPPRVGIQTIGCAGVFWTAFTIAIEMGRSIRVRCAL